jgi:hypothetical protein
MPSEPALPPVIGAIAEDRDGTALGTVTAVFLDDVTGEPTWVGLTDGLHAAPDSADIAIVAPIAGARSTGGRLRLTVPAEAVRSAPRPAAPDRLSPAEEETLRRHYAGGGDGPDVVGRGGEGGESGESGESGEGSMTRSEERLRVDMVREPWARAVLRVDTVTEEVMVPVTVTRQVARIEYLPLRGSEGTAAAADPTTSADADRGTGWVTLYSDRPVVTVERAPAERVRLATSWVTEDETVTDRLRREEIALEGDVPPQR